MMSKLSPERQSEIKLQNIDESDCGVIAIQALTHLPRSEAMAAAVKDAGYRDGFGVFRAGMKRALENLGYRCERIKPDPGETVAVFAIRHEYGYYMIHTDGHVMALVEGDLHNGRSDWHSPVEAAYKVERAE
jgi:hypothetical protein